MRVKHIVLRYFSIMGLLSKGRRQSYNQIKSYLETKLFEDDSSINLNFSKRTFQREIKEIEALFEVEISCDREGNYYLENNKLNAEGERFAHQFLFSNYKKYFENFDKHISFDHSSTLGLEHLVELQRAIKERQCVQFVYSKYSATGIPESKLRKVAPYGLKEYRGRWYLLSKDMNALEWRVFGLDRMSALEITLHKFVIPSDFDINLHFEPSIGVTVDTMAPVEIVVLRFGVLQGQYIKNLKLHDSQTVVEENDTHVTIRLKIMVNNELINDLLPWSDTLEIIKPLHLRNKFIARAELILKNNKNIA